MEMYTECLKRRVSLTITRTKGHVILVSYLFEYCGSDLHRAYAQ